MALIDQIQALLVARGKTGVALVDYEVTDNSDGRGPRITRWNVATLDLQPTVAELAAVTPAQLAAGAAADVDSRAMSDVDQKVLKALAQALWEAIPAPTLTKPQLRARLLALWKAL